MRQGREYGLGREVNLTTQARIIAHKCTRRTEARVGIMMYDVTFNWNEQDTYVRGALDVPLEKVGWTIHKADSMTIVNTQCCDTIKLFWIRSNFDNHNLNMLYLIRVGNIPLAWLHPHCSPSRIIKCAVIAARFMAVGTEKWEPQMHDFTFWIWWPQVYQHIYQIRSFFQEPHLDLTILFH